MHESAAQEDPLDWGNGGHTAQAEKIAENIRGSEREDIEEVARRLARDHKANREPGRKPWLTDDLSAFKQFFNESVRFFQGASDRELAVAYAAEWLLDNSHIVRQTLRLIGEDLPPRFYRQLPKLAGGPLMGYPRAYALAREIILSDHAHLDLDRVQVFVRAYESEMPLTMGELWALPLMLRLGIVQSLAFAISRITGLSLEVEGRRIEAIDLADHFNPNEIIANCFISLRALAAEDWNDFFDSLSLVEIILSNDPAGIYERMDFDTRDRYRKVVEEISLATGVDERDIAREAIRLASPGDGAQPGRPGFEPGALTRRNHVGYYLLDKGRVQLEASLSYRPDGRKRLARWLYRHATGVYLGAIFSAMLLFLALIGGYAAGAGGTGVQILVAVLLSLVPVLTVAVNLVNRGVTSIIEPRVLPKMDFSKGVPEDWASMVVVPALLSSPEEINSLLKQLELHYLRNPDHHLSFALLTDFSDAHEQHRPEDAGFVEQAIKGIKALNDRYRRGDSGPFYLFHRERRWNPAEGHWMGYERKRGKLHELNHLILQARRDPFPGWLGDGFFSGDHRKPYPQAISESPFAVMEGDLERLAGLKFIITLDADTIMPRDSAGRLVATLAHPLNRAVFASTQGPGRSKVVSGYTVLQPRTEINPTSANRSWFTRIYSGDTGLDLYTLAVSDVYQDFFGEGIYVGKGIYDIEAFERSLADVVPENALLSHDLFEGIHGRAGLATDIILIEDYPPHYLVQTSRMHRWIRGDWQLLPWLFPKVPAAGGKKVPNRLPAINRWKIADNLRRSLVSPSLLVFLTAGWIWLPGSPAFWTLLGLLANAFPLVTEIITGVILSFRGAGSSKALRNIKDAALRWLLAYVFLPYEAVISIHAILTTLVRLLVTRKGMLQWTTAAQSARRFEDETDPNITWMHLASSLLFTAFMIFLLGLGSPRALPYATPLLVAWLFSPEIANRISRPIVRQTEKISEPERRQLRRLARHTWLFFEQFMGPEDHWLPPDHFQESPLGIIAHRTSPTNIGFSLLTSLAAFDMGYVAFLDLAARLRNTFENMNKLERYRGHFLNWYDTRNLDPLSPRYVSTVDSGNLSACLMTLGQGCLEIADCPVLRWEILQGLLDTLDLLIELIETIKEGPTKPALDLYQYMVSIRNDVTAVRDQPDRWVPLLLRFSGEFWEELDRHLLSLVETSGNILGAENLRKVRIYTRRLRNQLDGTHREIELLLPWLIYMGADAEKGIPALLTRPNQNPELSAAWQALIQEIPANPKLNEIDGFYRASRARLDEIITRLDELGSTSRPVQEARAWIKGLAGTFESAGMAAKVLLIGWQDLYRQAETYVREMDFGFLFDPERKVFHIGYNLALGKLDNNYYDLLASEARIASLIAIGKGEVPQSHWLHLSRPLTQVDGTQALLSWSATMFEYLLPAMLNRNYEGTLLDQSTDAVIMRQILYGQEKRVPWGISESGYYRFDSNMVYQYRAFGVPGLGYKRGLGEDLVVAPYASLLALPFRPKAVVDNLNHLVELNMLGTFGLYEAVDFTPSRLSLGSSYEIVREYMAHHQGMILIALLNYFKDNLMVRRFHSDPRIQTVELLLQEQIPEQAQVEQPQLEENFYTRPVQSAVITTPWRVQAQPAQPRAHLLSNGRYSVMITSSGSGYSSYQDLDLTRWEADTTLNDWGTWIYVQDMGPDGLEPQALWSAGFQPTAVHPENMDVFFNAHLADFQRQDRDISLSMEVTIPPEDDLEIRRLTLTNLSDRKRYLRLTSYAEVILAPQASDQRHPAFNKLFIENEYIPELNTLLFRRRPRSSKEEPVFLAHTLALESGRAITGSFEGDRVKFLGRGGTPRRPEALLGGERLPGTAGATLDPVMSLSQDLVFEPNGSIRVVFLTLAARSRNQVLELARRYRTLHVIDRAFDQARSQSEIELRRLGLSTEQLERIERLLSMMLYPSNALRASPEVLKANRKGQSGLWGFGISGDYPILLVKLHDPEELALVQELLQAHAFWRDRKVKIDLVFLNVQGTDYGQELSSQLYRLIVRMNSDAWLNRRGGIFQLVADQMNEMDHILLEASARAILDGKEGTLADQLKNVSRMPTRLPPISPARSADEEREPTPAVLRPVELQFDNGLGGFSPDGREYIVYLEPGQWTPAPWINVIANPDFGFLVSEAGSGYSWAENSGENRLTPWNNDPVSDTPGEALYLRDEETIEVWSPTPLPARDPAPYLIRHGAGYSIFEHHSHGLKQELRLFAAQDSPVKVIRLRLENIWQRPRRITATYYAEWVLGVNREAAQQYVVPEYESDSQALLAQNAYNTEFSERVAFLAASKPLHGLSADRTEFLGRMGSYARPAALGRIGLASKVEAGIDPCAALQVHIELQPGESEEIYFILGEGKDREEALRLIERFMDPQQVETAWKTTNDFWERLSGRIQVKTPEPSMNLMLNQWLLYQALSCRIWGRSAFYQSSGAYGFRDQLQDVAALVFAAPEITREQILRAARHQFEAGDVLHWWHPPSGRGVRTRISDDLLWLPYITAYYIEATGDDSILNEKIPFRKAPPLEAGEEERYGLYPLTTETYSLYEHCRRALQKGHTKGPHDLPLIGGGDWNDGMNRVGIEGRGESIWLGWFLLATLDRFAEIAECRGDKEQAVLYRNWAADLNQALEANAWDGDWYLRAFYDDGYPLGSSANRECQIDSIAQSWAVLSGSGDRQRVLKAMHAVSDRLVREEDQIIQLFNPPFDKTRRDPGYIKGYLPGIRENGGQYTHAAIWTVWAFADLNQGDYAEELFRLLNPINHASTPEKVGVYKVEPYVIAADIYSVPPHNGRGGWTWYTGSSGWMYRLGIEAILGLRLAGETLVIDPCIPSGWKEYEIEYRAGEGVYAIQVENPDGVNRGVKEVIVDGEVIPDGKIPLEKDGRRHEVRVVMG